MNPQGSVCLNFLLCWHLFMENDYTTQVPPGIKPKQTAAKTTLKVQHALGIERKSLITKGLFNWWLVNWLFVNW